MAAQDLAFSTVVDDAITGSTGTDAWRAEPLPTTLSLEPSASVGALADLGHHVELVHPDYPNVAASFSVQVAVGVSEEADRAEYPELLEPRARELARIGRRLRRFAGWAERQGIEAGAKFNNEFFDTYDLLLTPTTLTPAVPIGQLSGAGPVSAMRKATPWAAFTSIPHEDMVRGLGSCRVSCSALGGSDDSRA